MTLDVLTLMYGEYAGMHMELLAGLDRAVCKDTVIHVGVNELGRGSAAALSKCVGASVAQIASVKAGAPLAVGRWRIYGHNNANRLKYPVMREMLARVTADAVVWMDDDIGLPKTAAWQAYAESRLTAGTQYMGKEYTAPMQGRQRETIAAAPWYRGLPPERLGDRDIFRFYTGGFIVAAMRVLRQLDWPPEDMRHNGGDTMLGEAMRQLSARRESFPVGAYGIRVNPRGRRGHSDRKPYGA